MSKKNEQQQENHADTQNVGDQNNSNLCYKRYRVENSHGDDKADKGYLIMTDDWFNEYLYEVVVDKKHLSKQILQVLEQEPIPLVAWDPMGALAQK